LTFLSFPLFPLFDAFGVFGRSKENVVGKGIGRRCSGGGDGWIFPLPIRWRDPV